jgi:hypothetical protein
MQQLLTHQQPTDWLSCYCISILFLSTESYDTFILRIKKQETRLILHEHDDDDDDEVTTRPYQRSFVLLSFRLTLLLL